MNPNARLATRLIHAGEPRPRIQGAVCLPIFQSAQFEYAGEKSYDALKYVRLNNTPNHQALHTKLASLEGAEDALVTGSGMAAISTAILACVHAGEHLLVQDSLYGGTHDFVTKDLANLGIAHDFIDPEDPDSWTGKLRPETRAIYVETLSNPLLEVPELGQVVAFARRHGLKSLIDNTFASPVNYRPVEEGFDLSLHSATKYLNGHSDIVAGAVVGSGALVGTVRRLLNHLGGSLDPHACFLLHRGMKTLELRMQRHNDSALRLAAFLEEHPRVEKVHYAGLPSSPHHRRAAQWFGGFGGVLSFQTEGTTEEADQVLAALELPVRAPSLGGVESLVTRPALTSHSGMTPAARQAAGIAESLIRVSVGIEDPEDLLEDFAQALDRAFP